MKIKKITVKLPAFNKSLILKVFGNEKSFIEHCNSHLLRKNDRWATQIDKNLAYEASASIRFGDSNHEDVIEFYQRVVSKIENELINAISTPLYFSQKKKKKNWKDFYFLSSSGLRIIADAYTIRTAYWGASPSSSTTRVFQKSYEYFVRKMIKARSLGMEVVKVTNASWSSYLTAKKKCEVAKQYYSVSSKTSQNSGGKYNDR